MPYSVKLSREKTFARISVAIRESFLHKIWIVAFFGAAKASYPRKFSPLIVSRCTVFSGVLVNRETKRKTYPQISDLRCVEMHGRAVAITFGVVRSVVRAQNAIP